MSWRIIGLLLLLPHLSDAQNLVPNPGFEEFTKCPSSFSVSPLDFGAMHWTSPNNGTPDYYNRCSLGDMHVPKNWAGVSNTHSGAGYAGIYVWSSGPSVYREYVQCQLMEPLKKDITYKVSFYYRISSYSVYAIDRVGILLTDSLMSSKGDGRITTPPTYQQVKTLEELTNGWQILSFDWKAKGGEKVVIIGNFATDEDTRSLKIDFRIGKSWMLRSSCYYYIDDVTVEAYDLENEAPDLLTVEDRIVPDEVYILNNIHFEFNSYKLLPSSFVELDELVKILKKNPSWTIELTGHTDDVGSESYNLQLSKSRAKSVGDYLSSNGVDKSRVVTQGYGKEKPLVPATSEEARQRNRRVELRFLN
jgi:Outer membrane protein and related peptidoglycan-associated (lipo)proteins